MNTAIRRRAAARPHARLLTAIAMTLFVAACGGDNPSADTTDTSRDESGSIDALDDTSEPDTTRPDAVDDVAEDPSADMDAASDASSDGSADVDQVDADIDAVDSPDAPDTAADAAADTDAEPDADAAVDTDAGPACDYVEIDTAIFRCDDVFRYAGLLRDTNGGDACPDVVRVAGGSADYDTFDEARNGEGCDACIWRPATSVSWIRCGRRGGTIRYASDTCGDLYELPEGLFPSLEAYEEAHPCPADDRPAGQCESTADCPGISTCSTSAPGGVCTGCGSVADCPDAADECSAFGACAISCDADTDCPRGQVCGGTNICRIQACVDDACPDPAFGCSESDLCQRVDCSEGGACPAGTSCTGGVCTLDA